MAAYIFRLPRRSPSSFWHSCSAIRTDASATIPTRPDPSSSSPLYDSATMNGHDEIEEVDLYKVLGLQKGAVKAEIKKAYHKAALSSHPDKVAADERAEAEVKFKAVSQAYEILYDDEKRNLYDTHGMAAFDPRSGGGEVDLDDILQQMFGMGGGAGRPPGFGGPPGPRRPRRGPDDEQDYEVTLEELYRGKTAKFTSIKNVICSHCKGTGGKDKAKPKPCSVCQGRGVTIGLRSVGPGLVTQATMPCNSCKGASHVFKDKDQCKRCKGERITVEKKALELYVPPGAKHGDRIVLEGEADQVPDQQPGDLVFILKQHEHPVFTRAGADLQATLDITLAESLAGFSRVVLKHLDGRGIHLDHPAGHVLRPDQILKVAGEGMRHKRSDARGDLYLVVKIAFPADGWLTDETSLDTLRGLLPPPAPLIEADAVDEVEFDPQANPEDFGTDPSHPRGSAWVDEDDDDAGHGTAQCAQQ
ncbi:MAG: hypothetical protein M1838_001438 [Thelocarpon superellum]|nr:MAG: hypothetical protein M1838_001438 [Thelocarpon superellum]